jgi:ABC-type nickel/cobalt efflux system permease component RcnA
VATLVAAAFLALPAPQALAHPLGNFTVSRYGGLEISNDRVTVHYVVDMAEIPAFQEKEKIDANHDGDVDRGELGDYATSLAPTLRDGISVSAGGDAIALAIDSAQATLRPGQGGLEVLRIDASFSGPLDSPSTRITYIDTNYAQRIGWQEVVAYAVGAQGIVDSTVPSTSVSNALRSYPKGRLASPLDVDSATVTVGPGAGAGNPAATGDGDAVDSPGADGGALADRFTALIGHDISLPFLGFALLLAFAAGALHALGPGHGKSIMAAYLVGTEGRFRHALLVGIAVSVMHTASVVALGLLVLGASRLFTPEAVFPWLSLVSGVVVLGLGVYMLKSRLAARRDALHQHAHDHSHGHEHTHSHGGRTHSHAAPAGVSPTSWKGLGVIALSGGLLPSPSALVVLLGAVALHRVFFGVVLVAAFSVGLAAALTAVGLLVIKARSFASRRYGRRITVQLPVLSAAAILTIGVFLTAGAALKL